MTRGWVLLAGLLVAGCGGGSKPTPVLMTPNSRLIYHDNDGHAVWTWCDRGTRVYMTHAGTFQAVPNGCLSGEP